MWVVIKSIATIFASLQAATTQQMPSTVEMVFSAKQYPAVQTQVYCGRVSLAGSSSLGMRGLNPLSREEATRQDTSFSRIGTCRKWVGGDRVLEGAGQEGVQSACLTHGRMTSACRLEGATKLSKEGFTNLVYWSMTPLISLPRHATSLCILQQSLDLQQPLRLFACSPFRIACH